MPDPAHDSEHDSTARPAPAADDVTPPATVTPPAAPATSYEATPLAGPTQPYPQPVPADPAPDAPRPRRRRGLLIGGVAAASLLVLGLTFGGGVALGAHLGGIGPQVAFEQDGFPGQGERPGPPDGFGPGTQDEGYPGQDGTEQDGTEEDGTTDGSGTTS